jgi:hypothetical protein
MRLTRTFVAVAVFLCAECGVARAFQSDSSTPSAGERGGQDPPVTATLSRDQMSLVERWVRDYTAWKAWFAKWHNRAEPGLFGTRERRPRPDPPAILLDTCPVPPSADPVLVNACRLLDEWQNDDVATELIKQQVAITRAQKETEDRSVWWRHVHFDALWPMTQGTSGIYGLVGLHSTIDLTGRVELFLAPGAMLMRVPGPAGPEWKPATDWGLSYRVTDFTMPGTRRPVTLHLNMARVWLFGQREGMPQSDMYLAGFSLTFRKMVTTH